MYDCCPYEVTEIESINALRRHLQQERSLQNGDVYAPGSAGTIQEVFMDAAQNHYETFGPASPMVFLNRTYWTETKPVYPLLETLAEDTTYEDCLTATDDAEAAVSLIEDHAPSRPA